jgi:ABC-type transporter Mla MlaB component
MFWKTRQFDDSARRFEALSRICRLVVSVEGDVQVILIGPRLTFDELAMVIGQLGTLEAGPSLRQVTINFEAIEEIVNPWTAVFALLMGLARRRQFAFQVISLHGQPRNIADLYRTSRELMGLLDETRGGVERPRLRRAG